MSFVECLITPYMFQSLSVVLFSDFFSSVTELLIWPVNVKPSTRPETALGMVSRVKGLSIVILDAGVITTFSFLFAVILKDSDSYF